MVQSESKWDKTGRIPPLSVRAVKKSGGVSTLLTGTYYHNLDSKSRLILPARLKADLGERFYITRWLDDCLVVFSAAEWQKICERVKDLPVGRSRDVQRFLFANAVEMEPDSHGRIVIPQELRTHSGIDKEVAIIGVMNRAEIWDKQRWLDKSESMSIDMLEDKMIDLDI